MAKTCLQATSLSALADGFAGRAIDKALSEVSRDIDDRGADGKARKLTIILTFTPEGEGIVDIDCQVTTKMPAFRPPKTTAKLNEAAGGLLFNPDCSENPDQLTTNDVKLDE